MFQSLEHIRMSCLHLGPEGLIQLGRGPSSMASKDPTTFPVKSGDPEIM